MILVTRKSVSSFYRPALNTRVSLPFFIMLVNYLLGKRREQGKKNEKNERRKKSFIYIYILYIVPFDYPFKYVQRNILLYLIKVMQLEYLRGMI